MKKLMMIMMCLATAMTSYSTNDEVKLTGYFIDASDVTYEICLLKEDGSCEVIKSKTTRFGYRITLEVGSSYLIRFTKNGESKHLFIYTNKSGNKVVDIDFSTTASGILCYNDEDEAYDLMVLEEDNE